MIFFGEETRAELSCSRFIPVKGVAPFIGEARPMRDAWFESVGQIDELLALQQGINVPQTDHPGPNSASAEKE